MDPMVDTERNPSRLSLSNHSTHFSTQRSERARTQKKCEGIKHVTLAEENSPAEINFDVSSANLAARIDEMGENKIGGLLRKKKTCIYEQAVYTKYVYLVETRRD